jgi:peptidoglycan/LPS O-acetylase OafA/YrhL
VTANLPPLVEDVRITRPTALSVRRVPVLDGFRAVAISFVLLGHSLWATRFHGPAQGIGYLGVSIFLTVFGPSAALVMPNRLTWFASIFGFRNYLGHGWETGHLWTLSLELQFYLLWPILFILTPRRFRLHLIAITVALLTVRRASVLHLAHSQLGFYSLADLRIDTFLIGGAFAISGRTFVKTSTAHLYAGAIILWSLIAPLYFGAIETPVCAGLIGGLITWLVKSPSIQLAIWLSKPIPVLIGTMSFSLYLWQWLFLGPRFQWWSLPCVALTASVSYFLIEKPALRLKTAIS